MGQIVKRKKKGRPSKADLARRSGGDHQASESDTRRSLRRRNVRYNIDIDDYVDEDDEDERRREKKLKLVLKLPHEKGGAESVPYRGRFDARGNNAPESGVSGSSSEYGNKTTKKRRIDRGDSDDDDYNNDDDDDDDDCDEERGRKASSKGQDCVPGSLSDTQSVLPLPDKKTLELILDKLQKKDRYSVYAEPVDPEELPDYHEVIEHPMDFATVRKKLGNGSYSTLQQFESDVFLICSNAMQYNGEDTVYYRQARSIQELARNKFQKLRSDIENTEKELKSDQKTRCNSLPKKQTEKFTCRTSQEPVGSDFSSGATLATAGEIQNSLNASQPGGCERPTNIDGVVEGISFQIDNNLEKADEHISAKNLLPKFGRKSFVLDENRRTTYNASNQPVVRSESMLTTFESEKKQLVAVGLQAENSYARSLARFAATLGPVAWKVASKRIEQALPPGFKFGRGWVGEYEPLPTPVLMFDNRNQKQRAFSTTKLQCATDMGKYDRISNIPATAPKEQFVNAPISEVKSSLFTSAASPVIEGKRSLLGSYQQQQNPLSRNISVQVELNHPMGVNQNKSAFVSETKQRPNSPDMATALRSKEVVSRKMNLSHPPLSSKQVDSNGGLPNGEVVNNRLISSFSDNPNQVGRGNDHHPNQVGRNNDHHPNQVGRNNDHHPNQVGRGAAFFSSLHGSEQQCLSDPVQMMRMLAQNQQKSSNHSPDDTSRRENSNSTSILNSNSNNAASVASRAWMSIGAGGFVKPASDNSGTSTSDNSGMQRNQISVDSLYNSSRLEPQVSRFRGEIGGNFQSPVQSSFMPHVQPNQAQFQNRPMVFPQLVTADLSRFQVQSPWRGISPNNNNQTRQKQEMLPPDLNIGFQPVGSPVRQSSSVLVDSQQPDLALQL